MKKEPRRLTEVEDVEPTSMTTSCWTPLSSTPPWLVGERRLRPGSTPTRGLGWSGGLLTRPSPEKFKNSTFAWFFRPVVPFKFAFYPPFNR